ncbi:hypothetical protein GOP47_0000911 [Adiantum capillus-veneris]|uniref:protein-serine/threonine phosphatase n=1 Tax=Adiantum capillus-veneris TaxID=13818 RepID=A0A9D4ZTD4_ADICA|nr:hypothetical protein GOP47_0000911 [Adiantum capillus-veneris]
MDLIDQEDACVLEQTSTTVIIESGLTARRKRMEIRRFKKVSCSGLSSVQQGTFKRIRPLRTSSICSVCFHSNDKEGDSDIYPDSKALEEQSLPFSSKVVAEFEVPQAFGAGDVMRGGGLVRSKSFPPQCLHTGRCVLHIRKTSRDHVVMNVEGHIATVFAEEQKGSLQEMPLEGSSRKAEVCSDTDPNSMDQMPPVVTGRTVAALNPGSDTTDDGKPGDPVSTDGSVSQSSGLDVHIPDPGNETPSGHVEGSNSKVLTGSSVLEEHRISRRCPVLSGKVLVCGRRREMEDTAVIAPYFSQIHFANGVEGSCDLHFFAVYDGHGGPQASNFCADRLHHALSEELTGSQVLENSGDDSEWKRVMTSCFFKMDREVGGICPNGACDNVDSSATCCMNAIAPENVGTTAVVAVLSPSQITLANCGDSRAVLSRGGIAIPLSKDHKPERADETSRIEAAGGRVIYWDGYRVAGLLALSRALGDRYLKQYVISEPDVLCVPRTNEDECLILASDGLWDVISNETACDVARRCLASPRRRFEHQGSAPGEDTSCAQVAALLVKLAYGRGSRDNISVVVIDLKSRQL